MKVILLLSTLVLAAKAASFEDILLQEWKLYKAEYGKSYDSPVEELERMRIFKESKHAIAEHNLRYLAGKESFQRGVNQFSDMLPEEVNDIYNGFNRENRLLAKEGEDPELPELDGELFVPPANVVPPKSTNWVEKGAVTPVKDQGPCGSCYAFAATGALEGHLYLKKKNLTGLSEQNIVDCSRQYGNLGCRGGLAMYSFNYIQFNGGVNDDVTYPYEAKEGQCRFDPNKIAGKCEGHVKVPAGDEEALKSAVALGPVAVSIDASLSSFHQYKSGVYSDKNCSSSKVNHAVVVVGYGTDEATKKDYWLVKNSWSPKWGDKGYMKMARNENNMCGITLRPVYPKV